MLIQARSPCDATPAHPIPIFGRADPSVREPLASSHLSQTFASGLARHVQIWKETGAVTIAVTGDLYWQLSVPSVSICCLGIWIRLPMDLTYGLLSKDIKRIMRESQVNGQRNSSGPPNRRGRTPCLPLPLPPQPGCRGSLAVSWFGHGQHRELSEYTTEAFKFGHAKWTI